MNCAKCGREIENGQVFCPVCLEEMEQYPVKPGTVVHIPKRPEDGAEKKPPVRRKAPPTPEQQIGKLKKKVRWLRTLLVLTMLLCGLLSFAVGKMVTELDFYRFLGQNYNTVETAPTSTTSLPTDSAP